MAYDFEVASSEYFDYGDTTILDGLSAWTFHAHAYLDDVTQDHYVLAKTQVGLRGCILFHDLVSPLPSNRGWGWFYKDGADSITRVMGATDSAVAGQWQIVTGTIDTGVGGLMDLWIDGAKDASSGVDSSGQGTFPNIGPEGLLIGSDFAYTSTRLMEGKVAEVAIWNRVLSDDEIGALHKSYSPRFFPSGLIFYAPLIRPGKDEVGGLLASVSGTPVPYQHPGIIRPSAQIIQFLTPMGVLAATEGITFGHSADLAAKGALAATEGIVVGTSADLKGGSALAATEAIVFGQSGDLAAKGALAATEGIVVGTSADLKGGSALAGTAAIAFDRIADLVGKGELAGSSALEFGESAGLSGIGSGAISGTINFAFGESADLAGKGELAGTAGISIAHSADLKGLAPITGTVAIILGESADLAGKGELAGSAAIVFAETASLANAAGGITATVPITFGSTADLKGSGALTGTATMVFALSGVLTAGGIAVPDGRTITVNVNTDDIVVNLDARTLS